MRAAEDADVIELDGSLETLQEELLELDDLLDVSEQRLDVLSRQKRLLFQRLQVALDQTVQILKNAGSARSDSSDPETVEVALDQTVQILKPRR